MAAVDLECCEEPRIIVDETASYECDVVDGKLVIHISQPMGDGFGNPRCLNCDKKFSDDVFDEAEW